MDNEIKKITAILIKSNVDADWNKLIAMVMAKENELSDSIPTKQPVGIKTCPAISDSESDSDWRSPQLPTSQPTFTATSRPRSNPFDSLWSFTADKGSTTQSDGSRRGWNEPVTQKQQSADQAWIPDNRWSDGSDWGSTHPGLSSGSRSNPGTGEWSTNEGDPPFRWDWTSFEYDSHWNPIIHQSDSAPTKPPPPTWGRWDSAQQASEDETFVN